MRAHRRVLVVVVAILAATSVVTTRGQDKDKSDAGSARYTALAVDMTGIQSGPPTPIDLTVTRWSTDAERDKLFDTVVEQDPDDVLKVLRAMPRAGAIAATGSVGFEIRFAQRTLQADGSERVLLVTDRPMSFWERRAGGRSTDYPFTVVELRVGKNGEGDGRILAATKLLVDKGATTLTLENYADQPIRLQGVKRRS